MIWVSEIISLEIVFSDKLSSSFCLFASFAEKNI
jgi:hypothetical protein